MLPMKLELGEKHPWAKEPENAWVFRCLNIPPEVCGTYSLREVEEVPDADSFALLTRDDDPETDSSPVYIPHTRAQVLRSWANGAADNTGHGVVVVIVGPQGFLLQCKDDLHPNEACRGRYSLFGGSCGVGEDPKTAAMREVYEEIRNVVLADVITARMYRFCEIELPCVQWEGQYTVTAFIARCTDQEFFSWSSSIMSTDGLAESNPALLTRAQFSEMNIREQQQRGTHFVAAHNVILSAVQ